MKRCTDVLKNGFDAVGETVRISFQMIRYVLGESPVAAPVLFVLSLLEGLLPVVSLWLVKAVVDIITATEQPGTETHDIWCIIAGFLGIGILSQVFLVVGRALHDDLAQRLEANSRATLLEKINSLHGLHYFETAEFHDKLERAEKGAGRRFYAVVDMTTSLTRSLVVLAASATLLGSLHPVLGILVIAGMIPHNALTYWMFTQRAKLFRRQAHDVREQTYYADVLSSSEAAKEVRVFGLGDFFLRKYRDAFERVYVQYKTFRFRAVKLGSVTGVLSGGTSAGAFAWVAAQAYAGHLTTGDAVLYIGLLPQISRVLVAVIGQVNNFSITSLLVKHFFAFLDLPPLLAVPSHIHQTAAKPVGYEFRDVTFRYPGAGSPSLEHVSFNISPGEKIGLVGRNGAGKSTLVKLLLRLYDPDEGEILLDGVPLKEYDINDLRRRSSVVFQDYMKFSLSVRENIALGDLGGAPDDYRVRTAARNAQADTFIETLPSGYDTLLGKHFSGGTELSGGQWQRIALARAFTRDADMVVLDEPSAALDPLAEYELYRRFHTLMKDRSALLVTHRLGSVRMVDRIFVLHHGKLIQSGSHDDLMKQDGEYAMLFCMQAEQYTGVPPAYADTEAVPVAGQA